MKERFYVMINDEILGITESVATVNKLETLSNSLICFAEYTENAETFKQWSAKDGARTVSTFQLDACVCDLYDELASLDRLATESLEALACGLYGSR